MTSQLLWRRLLVHALHCSVTQRSQLIPLPVSASDESGKQSLYPDGDPDHHQNLIICSLGHCHANPFQVFANRQTDNDENNLLGGGNNISQHA